MKRRYYFLVSEQGGGKTYQMREAVKYYAGKKSIDSIFICDRLGEFEDLGEVFFSQGQFEEYFDSAEDIFLWGEEQKRDLPRVCVFRYGEDGRAYESVFKEAINQGNCMVVLDESYEFSESSSRWVGSQRLRKIILSGRHIRNSTGEMCRVHVIAAAQYPKTVHHLMWSQSKTVLCGRIAGEHSRQWIRNNFGQEHLDAVDRLDEWEFHVLRGAKPPWLKQP